MNMTYCYSLYNFVVQSELPLLAPHHASTTNNINDVTISYGRVSKAGIANPVHQGFAYQASRTACWLNVPPVARFLVSNGQSIVIDPVRGADEDSILAFLFNTCLEVLLRQRQLTVIPGYALKMDNYGISFLGGSGLGQSMLQGLLYKQGYSFLAGNFIAFNDQGDMLPGIPQLEYWPTVISALKLENNVIKQLRPNIKKCVIPLEQQYHASPLRPKIMYTLKMHQQGDVLFTELHHENKLSYLQQLLAVNNLPVELWSTLPDLFNTIQMICIHLPMAELKLQHLADCIKQDVIERGHSYA
jgi:hypothetical protein